MRSFFHLAALVSVALLGCTPPAPSSLIVETVGSLVVASERAGQDIRTAIYAFDEDGMITVVAKAQIHDGKIAFARLGFDGTHVENQTLSSAATPALLSLIASTAYELARADCDFCVPTWSTWKDAPVSARFPFDDVGRLEASAASRFVAPVNDVGPIDALSTSCRAFPSFTGDQVCTGWAGRVLGNPEFGDILPCCVGHDACYFKCPIDDDECRGTDCIGSCNARLSNCCRDAGGAPLECDTFDVATDLGGGAGRNGCGRAKAESFCAALDVESDRCGEQRCVCEECRVLFPDGPSCESCDCVSECVPIEDPSCRVDGNSHAIRRCRFVDYGGNGCFKWVDERCDVGESCRTDGAGEPTCAPASCPHPHQCAAIGEKSGGCDADESGAFFRTCELNTDGCRVLRRVYCDGDGVGQGVCIKEDDGPRCTDTN